MVLQIKMGKLAGVFLFFLLMLTGCGDKNEEADNKENDDFTYEAEYKFFTVGESIHPAIFTEDGTVYFAGYNIETKNTKLFSLALEDKEPIEVPLELKEGAWITCAGRSAEGSILFSASLYQEKLDVLELIRMTSDGKIQEKIDITEIFLDIPNFEVECLAGDQEGNYYIGSGKSVYLINPRGELIKEIKAEETIKNLVFINQVNKIYARLSSGALGEINKAKNNLTVVKSKVSFGFGIYETGREKELLYTQGNTLYACDVKDEEPTTILNWIENDIDGNKIQDFIMLEDGRIAVFSTPLNKSSGEFSEITLLTKKKRTEVSEKIIISYGAAFMSTLTDSQVVRFNKSNPKYRVEIKQYWDENNDLDTTDLDTRKNLLQSDIVSGKGPDIIDIGLLFSTEEHYELIETGIFEDLNPYFEMDSDIKREDYLENVLHVYEKDSKLYAVMPTFVLSFLSGKVSDIGTRSSWTIAEMMEFVIAQPRTDNVIPFKDQTDMLNILCMLNMGELINRETGECYFDSDEFKQILEFASCFPKEAPEFDMLQQIEMIRSGESILLDTGALAVTEFQLNEYMFGEPVNFIGYPTNTGNGTIALPCASVIAMSSKTANKEGAWEFIKFLLADAQQKEMGMYGALGFPINKKALDDILNKQMEQEYYEDDDGNLQEKKKGGWGIVNKEGTQEFDIDFYASTEAETARIKELFGSIGNSMELGGEHTIFKIIVEESAAYFDGQKSVDEVAELIQSRVQTYVYEKM